MMEGGELRLTHLPAEILVNILLYLDLQSINQLEKVCFQLQELIATSLQIWKQKIILLCSSDLIYSNVLKFSRYEKIKHSSSSLRTFYSQILSLRSNLLNGIFNKQTINCLEAKIKDRRVVLNNPEWNKQHNYKGVYDMIFNEGRLCASVYDTIQIWDTQVYSSSCKPSYSLTHLFPKSILDQDNMQTTCFSLHKDLLICGTENGYIKLLDINSEKILVKARVNSYYISDIKYNQGRLISLDWFGNILHWKLLEVPPFLQPLGDESPEVPFLLQQRNIERLLDFGSDDLILTTFKSHITVYRDNSFLVSFPVYSDVFCIDKQDKLVGFGCKGGVEGEFVNPVAGIVLIDPTSSPFIPRILYFRTPDNDPVISIQLTSRFLILGDINGEIHLINVENLDIPSGESYKDLKPSDITTLRSHGYRDFVWALNTDGFRLFSGDETGQIIVHDFLHVDAQNPAIQDAQTPALKVENVKEQDEQDSVDKDV